MIWVLVSCLLCGAFFAWLAARLTTTKGNTISDVLNSEKLAEAEAIKIEILGKLKISSAVPIVALYIVAFAVATVLPGFIYWHLLKEVPTITLSGTVKKDPDKQLYANPKRIEIDRSGSFAIPLKYSKGVQIFNIESIEGYYNPITLKINLNKLKNSLMVDISNSCQEIPLEMGNIARLTETIPLTPAIPLTPYTAPDLSNTPSEEPSLLPSTYANIENPGGV